MAKLTVPVVIHFELEHLSGPQVPSTRLMSWMRHEAIESGYAPGPQEFHVCPDHDTYAICDSCDCNEVTGHYLATVTA